jgi:PAS domain S-box-containing protein
MTPATQKKSDALRRKAEKLVSAKHDTVAAADIKKVQALAQELAVHQVELELQNDELRETQALLQEVKDRYTQLYENAPVGYVVLDTSGIIRQANATWYSLIGQPGQDMRGHPFTDAMVPEDAPIFLARYRAFFRNPRDKQITLRLKHRGGVPFHALIEARPRPLEGTRDDGDKTEPGELMVVISDISKSKEAEAEIHRNVERLSMVVDILQYRSESVQLFLDYALEKAIALTQSRIGYIYFYNEEKREFILNTWSRDVMKACAVTNPQTCYALDKTGIWGEAVRQGKPIILNDYPAQHPHKKGYPEGHVALSRFLTVPIFNQGQIVAVVGVANKDADYDETDVLSLTLLMDSIWKSVETMKAENALRENERYLQTILRTTADGFWVIDSSKCIIDVNDTYCAMSGYGREELLGLGIADLDADEKPDITAARIERIISAGYEIFETRHRRKDGSVWEVEVSTTFLSEKGGLFICFCRDLTERKKTRDQQSRLEKAESLGRMAGAVAHHYNNLLSIVIGNLELAMLDQPDSPAHALLPGPHGGITHPIQPR